jgi:hypothetical protein
MNEAYDDLQCELPDELRIPEGGAQEIHTIQLEELKVSLVVLIQTRDEADRRDGGESTNGRDRSGHAFIVRVGKIQFLVDDGQNNPEH